MHLFFQYVQLNYKVFCTSILLMLSVLNTTHSFAQRRSFNKEASNNIEEIETKDNYKITLLLPLDKNQINKKSNKAIIQFYNGAKLALKDLDQDGIKITVRSLVLTPEQITHFEPFAFGRDLKDADLIISPIIGKGVDEIAKFALSNQKNFISAISPNTSELDNNKFMHIIHPTLETNIEHIVEFTKKEFKKNKKILLYNNNQKDDRSVQYLKEKLKGDKAVIQYDISYAPFNATTLSKQLSKEQTNVLFIGELNPKEIEKYLQVITQIDPSYEIAIIGLPTLTQVKEIKSTKNPNITFYYTYPFYYDANTAFVKKINQLYQSQYGTLANEMVYRGYELMYWYAKILHQYGVKFKYKKQMKVESTYTPFEMETLFDNHNNITFHENQNLYIYKINNTIQEIIENN
jgi:ABC-type branched-subunit amino acid transport system substrate-binding protein